MKKFILTGAALVALSAAGAAHAQEGAWNGMYVGAHGAYSDGKVHDKSNPEASVQDVDGWRYGAQVGFNSHKGNFLVGVEADVSFGKTEKNWLDRDTGGSQYSAYYGRDAIRTAGTVRARAGVASDNAILYLTGGLAIADTRHGLGCDGSLSPDAIGRCNGDGTGDFFTSESKTRFGYVVGGGVELAVGPNMSIKGEYNYNDYGKTEVTLNDPLWPESDGTRDFKISNHVAKVGVNFRF